MRLFTLVFLIGVMFINALPTTTVPPEEQSAKNDFEEKRCISMYIGTLQLSTVLFMTTMINRTAEFCSDVPAFQREISQFAADANLCLPEPDVFMINFAYQAVSEFFNYLCKSGGQNFEILLSNQAGECRDRMSDVKINLCLEDIYDIFSVKRVRKNICRAVKETELCAINLLTEHCPEFSNQTSAYREIFEAVSKPCNPQLPEFLDDKNA